MASISTSASIGAKMERPSFAKIAATGLNSTSAHLSSSTSSPQTQSLDISTSPLEEVAAVAPSHENEQAHVAPRPKRLMQLASQDAKELAVTNLNGPQNNVHRNDSSGRRSDCSPSDGLVPPSTTDDIGTQISSESGSFKPPSLDGKSVASATTFALDEKESLRPDDSASVKAVEDEELFSPPGSGLPGSRIGSDDGVRAFRDQLREISAMEPIRQSATPQMVGTTPKGVLYVPPQGPGIGIIPTAVHASIPNGASVDMLPDHKLMEALDSPRDRIWVLKLEQDIIDFVKDAKESSLNLPQCNSFYRMLAHKIADYYMLGHMVDDSSAAVRLYKTPNCRIPPPLTGITTPSTAASTPPPSAPQMKILRRGVDNAGPAIANGSTFSLRTTSENGDSSNEDDKKSKLPVSREEREARYEAARLRIMGSAKPSESPEAPKEAQESRSSSVTGKKHRKKARADSDDDFDSRSAYSNYYTTTYNPEALSPGPFGFSEFAESPGGHLVSRPYSQHHQSNGMQHMSMQAPNTGGWPHQPYQQVDPGYNWNSAQQAPYDLSPDFQRAMSFQNQAQLPNPPPQPTFHQQYSQQYYGSQQQWPHAQYQMPPSASQPSQGFSQNFPHSPGPPANTMLDAQPYAFGQLPSQAYPGRPTNSMEHPLPGSYKGKHFNPQSQSFVPGNASASSSRPFTPQGLPAGNPYLVSGFSPGGQIQRQPSAQAHPAASTSPLQPSSPPAGQNRLQPQPMTHPLPQPVFPRQPSPNMPLPPKPGHGPPRHPSLPQTSSLLLDAQKQQDQSVIAKWGTPASLPAKPPPSSEPFDVSRLPTASRSPFLGGGSAPRSASVSSPLLPSPQPGGVHIVNGAGQTGKRS